MLAYLLDASSKPATHDVQYAVTIVVVLNQTQLYHTTVSIITHSNHWYSVLLGPRLGTSLLHLRFLSTRKPHARHPAKIPIEEGVKNKLHKVPCRKILFPHASNLNVFEQH